MELGIVGELDGEATFWTGGGEGEFIEWVITVDTKEVGFDEIGG